MLSVVRDTHPCYVVIGNEVKASQAVRIASPETLVHFRITGHDRDMTPTREGGAERVRWLLPTFLDSRAQLLSIANEWLPSGDDAAQLKGLQAGCEAYIGAMLEANKNNVTIAVLDLSTGNPHLNQPGVMDVIRPVLAMAERYGHYLCVNHYARGGDPTIDPDGDLWVRLVKDYPNLRVVMREYNAMVETMPNGESPHGESFTRLLQNGDRAWARYPQFMGAAVYTLMGYPNSEWARFEFPGDLSEYRHYIEQS